ncbi:MAG: hypothetical protein JWM88_2133 [Verrucomicrobia bacterium]|nr:hypothetical protein [Verrucomicrobiota bacterium]
MKTLPRLFSCSAGLLAIGAAMLALTGLRAADADAVKMTMMHLPDGMRFAVIGAKPAHPAPTLFVLQGTLDVARRDPIYTEVARMLEPHGFISVLLDAPAHGDDHRPDEPAELAGWNARVDRGEDFAGDFAKRARAVLDYLVAEGYADPARVAACGTSRGGFLAFQLAAAEPRIRFIGGIAPVAELTALREFSATKNRALADSLSLSHLAPRLAKRPVWICIGNNDTRIDTDSVLAFTRALVKATAAVQPPDVAVPVEVIVNSSVGHRSSLHDHQLLAAWLLEQFGLSPAAR